MKFGKLDINPAKNPAILDTGTWDVPSAVRAIKSVPKEDLENLALAARKGKKFTVIDYLTPYSGSLSKEGGSEFLLAGLSDGQHVFAEFSKNGNKSKLGKPIVTVALSDGYRFAGYDTAAATVSRFFREIAPQKGSRALGSTPRLGVGVRMTTSCWPAILKAMERRNFCTNLIQNSVRELNFLSNLIDGRPADKNYASGFGTIETGYTGSTFEGLWLEGVLQGLKYPKTLAYGADADHLQVKRGGEGIKRAKQYIDSCRYYSFYTLDMADILGFQSLTETSNSAAAQSAESKLADGNTYREIVAYHGEPCVVDGKTYTISQPILHRLIGKYWDSLEVLEELNSYLVAIKNGERYDLEFTVDEHPPEVAAFDCLTSEEEYLFVLKEIKRRGLPVTHVAPNFGVEKGFDYRCPDGLEGLERRISSLFRIAESFDVMVDFHSADDLTSPVRQVIKKATNGKHHYKISPMVQIIYAGTIEDFYPELFHAWWNDALAYANREAAAGSPFARECLAALEANSDKNPSYKQMVFHHFSFAFVGKRDKAGQFLHREKFYDLSLKFYQEYEKRLTTYLCGLADELF